MQHFRMQHSNKSVACRVSPPHGRSAKYHERKFVEGYSGKTKWSNGETVGYANGNQGISGRLADSFSQR